MFCAPFSNNVYCCSHTVVSSNCPRLSLTADKWVPKTQMKKTNILCCIFAFIWLTIRAGSKYLLHQHVLFNTKLSFHWCNKLTVVGCGKKTSTKGEGVKLPPGISPLLDEIETKFQKLHPIFGVKCFNGVAFITVRWNRKSEIQHGGQKQEVLISQLLGEIETKFQMLHPHFWGPASQWSCFQYC